MLKQYHVSKNLFDINREWVKLNNTDTVIVSGNSVTITSKYYAKVNMPVPRNTDCVIKANVFEEGQFTSGNVAIYESDGSTRIIYSAISRTKAVPFNTGNNDEIWVYLYAGTGTEKTKTFSEIMLNEGSSALPYEPSDIEHDTLTTLPSTIYTNGTPLSSWSIYGAMTQTGTPSPSSPIYPQEVGDRTAQLVDYPYFTTDGLLSGVTWATTTHSIKASGTTTGGTNFYFFRNKVLKAGTYRITINGTHKGMSLLLRDTTTATMIANLNQSTDTYSFTLESDMLTNSLYFNQGSANVSVDIDCTIMLNTGAEALPYEPYGVKFPIVSGDTTTTVYSNEAIRSIGDYVDIKSDSVENRAIGCIDLGTLDYTILGSGNFQATTAISNIKIVANGVTGNAICSHFKEVSANDVANTAYSFSSCLNNVGRPFFNKTGFDGYTAEQFKEAMKGVYMWYVLATATTTSVTTPQIPTSFGENTIDVDTTLTPPRVDVSYTQYPWHEIPYYLYGTEQETVTELPTEIMADGNNAVVSIYGNMQQTTIPTPSSPVYPTEVGDKTGNLWNEDYTGISGDLKYVPVYVGDGSFTLSTDTLRYNGNAPLFLLSGNVTSGASTSINGVYNGVSRTAASSNGYITIAFRRQSETSDPITHNTMLNEGSTALPYQPYGYKLDISSANTTTPVYLGEVQSTRRIQKLVLTGQESFIFVSSDSNRTVCSILVTNCIGNFGFCTHIEWKQSYQNTEYDRLVWLSNYGGILYISLSNIYLSSQTATAFKDYLAQQYAAGTPVTIWYVLATPTTEVLNEPLRKIGSYVDTLDVSSVPTIDGEQTFDIQTTLKPSQVDITYHGWHKPYTPKRFSLTENTITTMPTTIHTGGTSLDSYKVYGAMTQTGTPSPSAPIYPSEVGDKTNNLADFIAPVYSYDDFYTVNTLETAKTKQNCIYLPAGDYVLYGDNTSAKFLIKAFTENGAITDQTADTISGESLIPHYPTQSWFYLTYFSANKYWAFGSDLDLSKGITVTLGQPSWLLIVTNQGKTVTEFSITAGNTLQPYEPYGVNFPIECGNTTTPIYSTEPIRAIGSYVDWKSNTQEYRVIKKLVLTGKESWQLWNGNYYSPVIDRKGAISTIVCSHFINSSSNGISYNRYDSSALKIAAVAVPFVTSASELKAWLAAQYAAGTPVCIWYALASPTTTPIEAPTIPTIQDTQVFDVDTTLPPSKVEIEYHDWQ